MRTFYFFRWLCVDLLFTLLSIALSLYIYYTPGMTIKHWAWLGNVTGYSSRPAIFVLPAVALFIHIVFNLQERSPSLLTKEGGGRENGDDVPAVRARALLYWKVLKLLSLFAINVALIVSYLSRVPARIALLAVLGLFLTDNILFLYKLFRKS